MHLPCVLAERVQTYTKRRSSTLKLVRAAHIKEKRAATIDGSTGYEVTGDSGPGAVLGPARRAGKLTLRSQQCSRFLQEELAAALPEICQSLVEKAKSGDVACAKALWHMAAFDRKRSKASSKRTANTGLAFARKVLAEFEAE